MRVHVIGDMQGVAGIVKWEQTTGREPLYDEGRRLYIGKGCQGSQTRHPSHSNTTTGHRTSGRR